MSEENKYSLDLDFILDQDEFNEYGEDDPQEEQVEPGKEEPGEETDSKEETTEIESGGNPFEESESVGSESEGDKMHSTKGANSSQKNFYSSIAAALRDEGILSSSDDSLKISDAESFAEAFEKEIQARFDDRQKRIDEALNNNVEVSEIKKYESTLQWLNSIDDNTLKEEGEKGETLRRNLIYQDYINKGFSQQRARKMVDKSFADGTDIDDAFESLKSHKEYYNSEYNDLIEEAKEEKRQKVEEQRKNQEALKKLILEEDKAFGDYTIDKSTRQKVYDNLSKVVYTDDNGVGYTQLQKYQKENPADFLKYVSLLYTLTDQFKSLDGLVKNKVKTEKRKYIKELENTLNNTVRTADGNLKFVSGNQGDPDSYDGWGIDV